MQKMRCGVTLADVAVSIRARDKREDSVPYGLLNTVYKQLVVLIEVLL